MRRLFVDHGWWGKCLRKLSDWLNIWWIKYFLLPVIEVVPPALILFSIDHHEEAETDNQQLQVAISLISDHPYWAFGIAVGYVAVWNVCVRLIQELAKDVEAVDSVGLLTLFEVLEQIVSAKAARFGDFVKSTFESPDEHDAAETFEAITRPDQQIALIAKSVHTFFEAIDTVHVNFRVCVILVENSVPADFYYWYPESEPPKANIQDLQSAESTVSVCIERKDIVIVPDVQVEAGKQSGRQYVGSPSSGQDEGSLLCYPVIHQYTNSIPYVIAVVADKRDYFEQKKKKFYKWVFRHFAVRMALEHSLLVLKQETNKP